ncbi:hypothetical protein PHYC_00943 [Phycisphaerales bacterium]|nr:hypothetical protein PHYC_00943 [Phycisphaerales bacterium]
MKPVRFNLGIILGAALAGVMYLGAWGSEAEAPKEALVVLSREAEPFRKCEKAVAARLKESGWTVRTVVIDDKGRVGGGEAADRVVAVGTEAATWAKSRASEGTSVVFCMVADAEGAGLTAQPNISGVLSEVPAAAQMSLIREALPKAGRVGILYKEGSARGERWLAAMRDEALKVGLSVDAQRVESKEKLGDALSLLLKRRVDVLWTMPDGGLYDASTLKAVLRATLEEGVPVFGFSTPVVRAGALVGVGIAPEAQGAQAGALMIDLAGRKGPAAEIVDPAFEVGVNLVVAERLQLSVPGGVVEKATHVFKGD